ncbi:MAG: mechanosensitive ion channel family protein [Bacteroides sp.]|nr:mechanosensitive ion channel family protein [Bacteroides sp.]
MLSLSMLIPKEPVSQADIALQTIAPDAHDTTYTVAKGLLDISEWILSWVGLAGNKVAETWIYAIVVLAISMVVGYVTKWIVLGILKRFGQKLSSDLYTYLTGEFFFTKLCRMIPALTFLVLIQFTLVETHTQIADILTKITLLYVLYVTGVAVTALISAIWKHVDARRNTKHLPLNGLAQLIKGIVWIVLTIIAVAILVNKSPGSLLAGLGAFAAVLMLIFKDSILGLVAGVQLSQNDSLHVGDWVKIDGTDANGTVTEVSLTAVKVLNWDKTTTSVPPYSLVSGSFTNYRSMQMSNTRRIQRSYIIDHDSIVPATPELLESLRSVPFMNDFITKKLAQKAAGKVEDVNNSEGLVDGTIDTNLGLFRAYLRMWLDASPYVSHDDTCFVSTLQQTENGVPLQIYCFTSTSAWLPYEAMMDTIFEHISAMMTQFHLIAYQAASGRDTILEGLVSVKDAQSIYGMPQPVYNDLAQVPPATGTPAK